MDCMEAAAIAIYRHHIFINCKTHYYCTSHFVICIPFYCGQTTVCWQINISSSLILLHLSSRFKQINCVIFIWRQSFFNEHFRASFIHQRSSYVIPNNFYYQLHLQWMLFNTEIIRRKKGKQMRKLMCVCLCVSTELCPTWCMNSIIHFH